MKILILINDAPYGTEKAYNALRLANQLSKDHQTVEVRIFLMADAANCSIANQATPNGYYNIERMLKISLNKGLSNVPEGKSDTDTYLGNICKQGSVPVAFKNTRFSRI